MRRGRRPSVKEPAAREVQHALFFIFPLKQNSRAQPTTERFSLLFHRIGGLIIRQISRASQQRNFLATRRKDFLTDRYTRRPQNKEVAPEEASDPTRWQH